MSPGGLRPAQRPLQGAEPQGPAQKLPFCWCLEQPGKEGEALPGADPAPRACRPVPAQPRLPPSLPVPLHPQKHPQ